MISVKGGRNVKPDFLRELRGVVEREKAQIGVLVVRDRVTKEMRSEAASAGFYYSPWLDRKYPKIQILTIGDLISGKRIDMPPQEVSENITFRKGPKRAAGRQGEQLKIFKR